MNREIKFRAWLPVGDWLPDGENPELLEEVNK